MTERMTLQNAQRATTDSADGLYGVLLENGSMELGYYQPKDIDEQSPHDQDEIYIVQTGTGTLARGDEKIAFGPGDALFVAAGIEHHFINFSNDFGAWVVFYGPPGGEG